MTYTIQYKKSVAKDLQRLDVSQKQKIMTDIRENLSHNPRLGIPLKGKDISLWRYRIGNYRVVYTFNDHDLWILVVRIAHRKEVYRDL